MFGLGVTLIKLMSVVMILLSSALPFAKLAKGMFLLVITVYYPSVFDIFLFTKSLVTHRKNLTVQCVLSATWDPCQN